ncbi:hypothetical protein EVAR_7274_1 [Eumeta japonica]|uniref:Uncharacterized protein n=1 Tax=Eumeta variegata TaxID=151549 RepID=A0A4C1T3B9_EUMVA|nr:hypothetical protein EVAR_7274_1 [Eumeta japonica]
MTPGDRSRRLGHDIVLYSYVSTNNYQRLRKQHTNYTYWRKAESDGTCGRATRPARAGAAAGRRVRRTADVVLFDIYTSFVIGRCDNVSEQRPHALRGSGRQVFARPCVPREKNVM